MLILGRKENESVVLRLPDGETVIITLTQLGGSQIRLGIEAPSEVGIYRKELFERINSE